MFCFAICDPLDEWGENIRKWETISGDLLNESMKKTIFLDPSSLTKHLSIVRIPLQMQSLDTFESMTAVTLQFLQHNAQYQADVTVSPDNKKVSNDMDIDALTIEGSNHKEKGKSKADRQKSSCFGCGRVGHMIKELWFKDTYKVNTTKDCLFKDTNNRGYDHRLLVQEHEQEWTIQQQRQERKQARAKAKERTASIRSPPRKN